MLERSVSNENTRIIYVKTRHRGAIPAQVVNENWRNAYSSQVQNVQKIQVVIWVKENNLQNTWVNNLCWRGLVENDPFQRHPQAEMVRNYLICSTFWHLLTVNGFTSAPLQHMFVKLASIFPKYSNKYH